MKKYTLNPKEELRYETKPNKIDQARKANRALLFGSICAALLAWFFKYVMKSIPSFYPLFLLIGLICAAGFVMYIAAILKAKQGEEDEKYYITNVRVVSVDKEDTVLKEVYLRSIDKIVVNKVTGKTADIVINPKEETDVTKLRKHKSNDPLYTTDTFVLYAVDAEKVKEALGKK